MADHNKTATTADHSDGDLENTEQKRRKLSPEEVEALNKRIYEDSITRAAKKLEEARAKVYQTAEPVKLDKTVIEASVTRQVNDEMERRKRKSEELKQKFYKEAPPKTLSSAEIEDSVRRIYSDTMRQKQDKLAKLDEKYGHKPPESKKISDEERKASADRLSKPKKKEWTTEEINKIYGF